MPPSSLNRLTTFGKTAWLSQQLQPHSDLPKPIIQLLQIRRRLPRTTHRFQCQLKSIVRAFPTAEKADLGMTDKKAPVVLSWDIFSIQIIRVGFAAGDMLDALCVVIHRDETGHEEGTGRRQEVNLLSGLGFVRGAVFDGDAFGGDIFEVVVVEAKLFLNATMVGSVASNDSLSGVAN